MTLEPAYLFDIGDRHGRLFGTLYTVGKRYQDFVNTSILPAYTTFDAGISLQLTPSVSFAGPRHQSHQLDRLDRGQRPRTDRKRADGRRCNRGPAHFRPHVDSIDNRQFLSAGTHSCPTIESPGTIAFLIGTLLLAAAIGQASPASAGGLDRRLADRGKLRDRLVHPRSDDTIVIAHRACWKETSENSLAAVRACIAMHVDGVEFDVRHTKDGVAVIMHDETRRQDHRWSWPRCGNDVGARSRLCTFAAAPAVLRPR